MPRLDFMDAAAQSRLIGLASDAVELARDNDMSPTDALTKVATDNSLNADEINRVKEAINTAAVLAMRKQAAAGQCAYDDITPLVDGAAVIGRVFKSADKPDEAAVAKVAASIEPESFDFTQPQTPAMTKVASAPAVEKRTRDQLLRDADVAVGHIKLAAEIHNDNAVVHRTYSERKIAALVEVLRGTDAPQFAEIEKTAMALYPGEGLGTVFDVVYKAGNLGAIGHRRHTGALPKYASTRDHADLIAKVRDIRDDIGYFLVEKMASDELYAKADRGGVELIKIANDEKPKGGGSKSSDEGEFKFNPMSVVSPTIGAAASLGDSVIGGVKDMSTTTEETIGRMVPGHQRASINERLKSEIGNDRLRLNMSKIMDSDPVVSKFSKDKVVQAYNEITTLQPSLATQPLALRSALRRYLVSGGDFTMQEAMQMRNFEKPPIQLIDPTAMQEKA